MSEIVKAVWAISFALIMAIAGFALGRRRKGVEMPPNPVFPKRQKTTLGVKHEQSEQAIDAVVEAANEHDADPAVVSDGLEWLYAIEDDM